MSERSTAERIAEATLAILRAEGPEAVTMRRVATAAGITPMAIYKHFPNRRALLRMAAAEGFAHVRATWSPVDRGADFTAIADGMLEAFLDFALGDPHLYAFLITDRREDARRFPDDFREGDLPPFTGVAVLIEEGMRAGILRDGDPVETALVITAHTQGLVQLYLGGRIGLTEPDFRALCRRATWRIFDGLKA